MIMHYKISHECKSTKIIVLWKIRKKKVVEQLKQIEQEGQLGSPQNWKRQDQPLR